MLRSTVSSLQQREADALAQVQQSVEVAEQAQLERVQVSLWKSYFYHKIKICKKKQMKTNVTHALIFY